MTFREAYLEERSKPTPSQIFINQIAEVTCRETSTVRQWLSGIQAPNAKAKQRIAAFLNRTIEELFPEKESSNISNDHES